MHKSILLGVTALAACSGADPTASNKQLPTADSGRWQIVLIDSVALADDDPAWVEINREKGYIVANAGCNQLQAKFEGNLDNMRVGPVAATKKGCPEAMMARDRRLTEMLGAANSVKIDDQGVLWISGARGMLKARQSKP